MRGGGQARDVLRQRMATRITYRHLDLVHEALERVGRFDVEDVRLAMEALGVAQEDPASVRLLAVCTALCRQQLNERPEGEGSADFSLARDLQRRLGEVLHEAAQSLAPGKPRKRHFAMAVLHLVERTLRLRPAPSGRQPGGLTSHGSGLSGLQSSQRKLRDRSPSRRSGRPLRCGTYSTPDFIADAMISDVLRELSIAGVSRPRILDLSLEAGHFALVAATLKAPGTPVTFYGVDRDSQALAVARQLLAFLREESRPCQFELRTSCQDSLLQKLPPTWPTTFDAIVGNPPWQPIHVDGPEFLHERFFPYLTGRSDISLAFILRAHELLAPGSLLSLVLPSGFLFNQNATAVRRLLLDEYDILSLNIYPQSSFVEVPCLIPVSFLARKKTSRRSYSYRTKIKYPAVSLGGKGRPQGTRSVRAAHVWRQLPLSSLNPLVRADCAFLLRIPGDPLATFGALRGGARLARKRQVCPPKSFQGIHARDIRPFHVCPSNLLSYPADEARFDRGLPQAVIDRVKVVYQDFRYMTHRNRLVAAVAGPGVYPVSTASFFSPEDPALAHFFTSFLNSALANAWYKLHDTSRTVKLHHMRSLPLVHDEGRWRRIGEVGRRCARQRDFFHRYMSDCRIRDEERRLSIRFPRAYARLVELQQAIDEEVFDLYGLSDRCRKVVKRLAGARVF